MNVTFCPQALEWGDVATWAGAVASSVAVGIALWLGARDIIARRAEEKRLTRILSILLAPRIANAQNHLILVTKCGRHVQVWANADVAARADFLNLVKTCPINLLAPQFYEKAPSIFQEGSASLARAHGLLSSAMYMASSIENRTIEAGTAQQIAINIILTTVANASIHLDFVNGLSKELSGPKSGQPWRDEKAVTIPLEATQNG